MVLDLQLRLLTTLGCCFPSKIHIIFKSTYFVGHQQAATSKTASTRVCKLCGASYMYFWEYARATQLIRREISWHNTWFVHSLSKLFLWTETMDKHYGYGDGARCEFDERNCERNCFKEKESKPIRINLLNLLTPWSGVSSHIILFMTWQFLQERQFMLESCIVGLCIVGSYIVK